ncbi:MAG: hypothetical protein Q9162_005007 [Coniocarpon cinnabarinum]
MPKQLTAGAIFRSTVQAVTLSLLSSTLAQLIAFYRSSEPFSAAKAIRFAIFAALSTPPNVVWQSELEGWFPSYTSKQQVTRYKHSTHASDFSDLKEPSGLETEDGENERRAAKEELKRWESTRDSWTDVVETKRGLDYRNTAIKFLLDQTLGALVNTILFVGGIAGLKGEGREAVFAHVRSDTMPLMVAGYKFWPLISIGMFTVVPAEQRVVVGSAVGVVWGIFLALFVK